MYARGVGSYPGEPCYDPTRASWLPYWLYNDTELLCNMQSRAAKEHIDLLQAEAAGQIQAPSRPPTPSVPAGGYVTGPGPTVSDPNAVDNIIATQAAAWRAQAQQEFTEFSENNPVAAEEPGTNFTTVALVVAGIAAVSLFRR